MKYADNIENYGLNQDALSELKINVSKIFPVDSYILFGSVSRRSDDEESDIDLLIITEKPLSYYERHMITDIITDINIKYDTNFTSIVIDVNSWENGMVSVLPFYNEVKRDGIRV